MTSEIEDLKNALSDHLLSSPYDPKGSSPYHQDIDALANLTRDFAHAEVPPQTLRNAFRELAPGFDFDAWAEGWIEGGVFSEEMLEDWDEED